MPSYFYDPDCQEALEHVRQRNGKLEAENQRLRDALPILARLVVWADGVAAPEGDRIHSIVADAVAALDGTPSAAGAR